MALVGSCVFSFVAHGLQRGASVGLPCCACCCGELLVVGTSRGFCLLAALSAEGQLASEPTTQDAAVPAGAAGQGPPESLACSLSAFSAFPPPKESLGAVGCLSASPEGGVLVVAYRSGAVAWMQIAVNSAPRSAQHQPTAIQLRLVCLAREPPSSVSSLGEPLEGGEEQKARASSRSALCCVRCIFDGSGAESTSLSAGSSRSSHSAQKESGAPSGVVSSAWGRSLGTGCLAAAVAADESGALWLLKVQQRLLQNVFSETLLATDMPSLGSSRNSSSEHKGLRRCLLIAWLLSRLRVSFEQESWWTCGLFRGPSRNPMVFAQALSGLTFPRRFPKAPRLRSFGSSPPSHAVDVLSSFPSKDLGDFCSNCKSVNSVSVCRFQPV